MHFTPEEELAVLSRSTLPTVLGWEVIDQVKKHYEDPSRHYHDWQHALSVISWTNHVADVIPAQDLNPFRPVDLSVAALFHDVIYLADQGSPKNEEQSVQLMRELIPEYPWIDRPAELIMATAEHGKHKRDANYPLAVRLFLDCDLAFFLADPRYEVFQRFNYLVELEYLKVYEADQVFAGRRKFLSGMLDHDHIFLTDYFRSRFELQAKANLRRLLSETPSPTSSDASH
jgi:predicted metal-dependent HD superfamily phosphohydrolase